MSIRLIADISASTSGTRYPCSARRRLAQCAFAFSGSIEPQQSASKGYAKIAFVQADDPRSNLRVPNRVDWVSECCRLLAEDDEDVYFISNQRRS